MCRWRLGAGLGLALAIGATEVSAQMTAHTVATGIRGGYQVVAVDDRDRRPDLVALGSQMPDSCGSRTRRGNAT